MLSPQAKVLNFILKNTVKQMQAYAYFTPSILRSVKKNIDKLTVLAPKTPDFVTITPVENGRVDGEWVETGDAVNSNQIVLYLHGGGYFFGSPKTHRPITWRLSGKAGVKVFAIQYRMMPEHRIGDAMDDAVDAYEWLIGKGYKAENITIGGDSAGGGLTLITLLELKNRNLPMPKAAFCISPYADLTNTSNTIRLNAKGDILFHRNAMEKMINYVQKNHDPSNPQVSPVFGDYSGLPPLFFQVGSSEMLVGDTIKAVKKAKEAGIKTVCKVWDDMPHVFTIFSDIIPEGRRGIQEIADFINT